MKYLINLPSKGTITMSCEDLQELMSYEFTRYLKNKYIEIGFGIYSLEENDLTEKLGIMQLKLNHEDRLKHEYKRLINDLSKMNKREFMKWKKEYSKK